MMPASILAEAIRNQEEIHIARERVAVREHVARNYRSIALPALAAAARPRRTGTAPSRPMPPPDRD
jgi:hypothetical protein